MNGLNFKKRVGFFLRRRFCRSFSSKSFSKRFNFLAKHKKVNHKRNLNGLAVNNVNNHLVIKKSSSLFDEAFLKKTAMLINNNLKNSVRANQHIKRKNNFFRWILKINMAESLLHYLRNQNRRQSFNGALFFMKSNQRLISLSLKKCIIRLMSSDLSEKRADISFINKNRALKLKKLSILFKLASSRNFFFSDVNIKTGSRLSSFKPKQENRSNLINSGASSFLGSVSVFKPRGAAGRFLKFDYSAVVSYRLKYLSSSYLSARLRYFTKSYNDHRNYLLLNGKFNRFKCRVYNKGRRTVLFGDINRLIFSFEHSKAFFSLVLKNKNKNSSSFLTSFFTLRRSYKNLSKEKSKLMLSNRGFYKKLLSKSYEISLVKRDDGLASIPQNTQLFKNNNNFFREYRKVLFRQLFYISNRPFTRFTARTLAKWLEHLICSNRVFSKKRLQEKKVSFLGSRFLKSNKSNKAILKNDNSRRNRSSKSRIQLKYRKLFGFTYSDQFVKNRRRTGYDLVKKYETDLAAGYNFHRMSRAADMGSDEMYKMDARYVQEFIYKKKSVNKYFIQSRYNIFEKHDIQPQKYFFFNSAFDPAYGSFLLNKVINVFAKHGCKKRVRKIFYDILFDDESDIDIFALYQVITALRPDFLNIKARRGSDIYTAPIEASETKAIMKAIKFFKRAVFDRKSELSLAEKIYMELWEFTYWEDFTNSYYENYVNQAKSSMHLRHFRSQKKY